MTDHRRSRARRVGFCAALVALIVAVTEAVAWLAHPLLLGESFTYAVVPDDRTLDRPDDAAARDAAGTGGRDPTMCVHPYLGYVYTPEANDSAFTERIELGISEHGFLDDQPPFRARAADKVVVGLFGGSVAAILATHATPKLAEELGRHPEFEGKEIEFVRLALAGYRQPQQLFTLSWVLMQGGEFDVVINLDGFNEIALPAVLNEPKGVSPLYPMNWSLVSRDVPNPVVRRHMGAIAHLKAARVTRAQSFARSWVSWSTTATLIWRIGDQRFAHDIATRAEAIRAHAPDELPYFVRGPRSDHTDRAELIDDAVGVWRRCSEQMHALCVLHGIRYFHFLQLSQDVAGSKELTAAEREKGYAEDSPYKPVVELGYPVLRRVGEELRAGGVPFFDLTRVFADSDATLYVDVCCHFNQAGNAILSRAIAKAIHDSW